MKLVTLFTIMIMHAFLYSMNSSTVWKVSCDGDQGRIRISDKQKKAFNILNEEREVLDGQSAYALDIPIAPRAFCHLLMLHRSCNNPKKQKNFRQLISMREAYELLNAAEIIKEPWAQKTAAKIFYKKMRDAACSNKLSSQALKLLAQLPAPLYARVANASDVSTKLLAQEWKTSKPVKFKNKNPVNDLAISDDGKWLAVLENDHLVLHNVPEHASKLTIQRNQGRKEDCFKKVIAKTDIKKAGIFNSDSTFFAYTLTKFTERDRKKEPFVYDSARDMYIRTIYDSFDEIRIINLKSGVFFCASLDHDDNLQAIAFKSGGPEAKFLAATSASDNNLIVWDNMSKTCVITQSTIKAISDTLPNKVWGTVLAWGDNNTLFLNNGTTIEQWDSESAQCIKKIPLPVEKIKALVPLADNDCMICVRKDRDTGLQYIPSGQYLGCIASKEDLTRRRSGYSVRLSSDGKYMAVFNNNILGREIQMLNIAPVQDLALEKASLEQKIAVDALLVHGKKKKLAPEFKKHFESVACKDIINKLLDDNA